MKENIIYWIWLQQALKYKNRKIKYIREFYEDIEQFYISGEKEWRLLGIFSDKDIENLKNTTLEDAKKVLDRCEKLGAQVLTIDDEKFPYLLKEIADPPAVLYIRGDVSCMSGKLTIAIVGTRKASNYGFDMASKISKTLAENDVVVVSGGALGIDSAAHESAVDAGGKTVCVLGCGLGVPYLNSKRALKQDIVAKGGAVITEYAPGTPARAWTFPARNRIISGLSHGTVVVEAGEKSGSLITANLANEQNRDVFVVAPNSGDIGLSGNVSLINDGAQVITSGEDILHEYSSNRIISDDYALKTPAASKRCYELKNANENYNSAKNDIPKTKEKSGEVKLGTESLTEEERKVYEVVAEGKVQVNSVVEKSNLPARRVLSVLTTLELFGLVKSYPGKYYEVI